MYKIIDLGHEVPETGESRVNLIDPQLVPSLIKSASQTASTEIQEFWDTIPQDPRYSYLWVIGVSAKEYYGCNNNGDAFTEEDLKHTHQHFVDNANVFLQHVNKDPAKGIGKPVFSWYNDDMHRVELILRIDKSKPEAVRTVSKITNGEPLFVSMGCTVTYDVCSICGNKAPTRRDYCDHLRFNMKKILPDGRQVYALNPNPKFFDISIVAKPADPTAHMLDKRASLRGAYGDGETLVSSAELGEHAEDISQKLAASRTSSRKSKAWWPIRNRKSRAMFQKPKTRMLRLICQPTQMRLSAPWSVLHATDFITWNIRKCPTSGFLPWAWALPCSFRPCIIWERPSVSATPPGSPAVVLWATVQRTEKWGACSPCCRKPSPSCANARH